MLYVQLLQTFEDFVPGMPCFNLLSRHSFAIRAGSRICLHLMSVFWEWETDFLWTNFNLFCQYPCQNLFFFLISKKFIESKKVEHPSTQGVYKGSNNQEQKLQESKKSRKDEKDWFRKAANQSIKVLKKNSFKSDMDLSLSSKHRLLG